MFKDIAERVSYLQGLSEGLNINDGGAQGKIITGILEVLEEIAGNITDIRAELTEFRKYVESIDDDLFELEENVLNESEEDEIELMCDNCGEKLYFNASLLDDDDVIKIICPRCNEVVFINDGSFDFEPDYIDEQETGDDKPEQKSSRY